ncbi:MAG TPA: hypothetical protein VF730_04485 [Terracidiphilus sp.]
MLSRKSAGAALFLTFLMLCGLAAAEEDREFTGREGVLAAANFDLTLSAASSIGREGGWSDRIGPSSAWSQTGTWTLSTLPHGMGGYVLTVVVTGTGESGFTGVSLQSTTATQEGYFGSPVVLASNSPHTSFVAEPQTASFMIIGIFFAGGLLRQRVAVRQVAVG